MSMRHQLHLHKPRTHGFALLMALVFLLLMTTLAILVSRHTLLQERIAGSFRNAQQARMSAETALRGAEYKVWSTASSPGAHLHCLEGALSADGCIIYQPGSAPYDPRGLVTRFRSSAGWLPGIGVTYFGPTRQGYTGNTSQPTASLARNPVYLIEDLGLERPPGAGALHESGNTGPNNAGQGELDIHLYRITSRATGGNPNVVRVMQSTFDAPVNP